jgi:hypothetical protein
VTRQTDARSRTAIRASSEQRPLMRIGAVAGVTGVVAQTVLELFLHPSGAHPNDSAAAFAEYAASTSWTAVHLGQFAAVLLVSIALIALAGTLRSHGGWPADLALVGALAVAVATAVFGVQMAVDGVALKHAVVTWTGAAPGAQETAFTIAESVRSIEKGLSALFHFSNGAALLLLGGAVATSLRRRWLGWIGAAAGFGFLAGSWATAQTGFSSQASMVLLPAAVLAFIFVLGVSTSMGTGAMSADSET